MKRINTLVAGYPVSLVDCQLYLNTKLNTEIISVEPARSECTGICQHLLTPFDQPEGDP